MDDSKEQAGSLTPGPEACRAYTKDEAKDAFLYYIRGLVDYWAELEGKGEKDKLAGLAFSMLNIFDGTTMEFPAMDIVMRPDVTDEQFQRERGENWWPDGLVLNDETHLHEEFYKSERTKKMIENTNIENEGKDVSEKVADFLQKLSDDVRQHKIQAVSLNYGNGILHETHPNTAEIIWRDSGHKKLELKYTVVPKKEAAEGQAPQK